MEKFNSRMVRIAIPGFGSIAGEAAGIATIDNVPSQVEIRVFRRADSAYLFRQYSMRDGTYRIAGVESGVEYDLVARDPSGVWEDVIVGRVLPFLPLAISGVAPDAAVGMPYSYSYTVSGGEAPYTATLTGALPTGLVLAVVDNLITLTGTVPAGEPYSAYTVTVTDARGASASVADQIEVAVAKAHWRILITLGGASNPNTSLVEIRMRAAPGGANLATGGTAFGNTAYSGSYSQALAFDGNLGTRWAANGAVSLPHIIGYTLPSAAIINQVELVAETDQNSAPREFTVQSSLDGEAWVDEWVVTGLNWSASEAKVFNRP